MSFMSNYNECKTISEALSKENKVKLSTYVKIKYKFDGNIKIFKRLFHYLFNRCGNTLFGDYLNHAVR